MSAAPATVSLSFSEALEPRFSSVIVTNASGARADKNDLTVAAGDAKTYGCNAQVPGTENNDLWTISQNQATSFAPTFCSFDGLHLATYAHGLIAAATAQGMQAVISGNNTSR